MGKQTYNFPETLKIKNKKIKTNLEITCCFCDIIIGKHEMYVDGEGAIQYQLQSIAV